MGKEITTVGGWTRTFQEVTPGTLHDKEGYAVEITAAAKVQPYTSGVFIGWFKGYLEGNSGPVTIALAGPTVRAVQNGASAPASRMKPASGGKMAPTTTADDQTYGIKIWPDINGADGDLIELLQLPWKFDAA